MYECEVERNFYARKWKKICLYHIHHCPLSACLLSFFFLLAIRQYFSLGHALRLTAIQRRKMEQHGIKREQTQNEKKNERKFDVLFAFLVSLYNGFGMNRENWVGYAERKMQNRQHNGTGNGEKNLIYQCVCYLFVELRLLLLLVLFFSRFLLFCPQEEL